MGILELSPSFVLNEAGLITLEFSAIEFDIIPSLHVGAMLLQRFILFANWERSLDVSPIPVVLKIISLNWEDVIVCGIIVLERRKVIGRNWIGKIHAWIINNLSDSETKNLKLNGFLNWHNDVWIIFRLNNMKEIQAFFKIIIKFVGKENIIYWFLKMKNRNRSIEKFCNKKKSYIFSDL